MGQIRLLETKASIEAAVPAGSFLPIPSTIINNQILLSKYDRNINQ
jgi:hypothetical protein